MSGTMKVMEVTVFVTHVSGGWWLVVSGFTSPLFSLSQRFITNTVMPASTVADDKSRKPYKLK